jgi:hypothetical protein
MTVLKLITLLLISSNLFAYEIKRTSVKWPNLPTTYIMWQVRCDDGIHWCDYSTKDEAEKGAAEFCKSYGTSFVITTKPTTSVPSGTIDTTRATFGTFEMAPIDATSAIRTLPATNY